MKKSLLITVILASVVIAGSLAYYFVIALPNSNQQRLEFDRQKQITETALEKESLKNDCLKLKFSADKGTTFQAYQQANLSCD